MFDSNCRHTDEPFTRNNVAIDSVEALLIEETEYLMDKDDVV